MALREASEQAPTAPAGLVTRAALAAELGVAPARINRWVADGCPVAVRGRRGHPAMYDAAAVKAWRAQRASSGGPEPTLSLSEERARLARAQRERVELQNKVRTGELVERVAAVSEGRSVVVAVKARLLALPRQAVMRGLIPREGEPGLKALVVEALRELARWKSLEEAPPAAPDEPDEDPEEPPGAEA